MDMIDEDIKKLAKDDWNNSMNSVCAMRGSESKSKLVAVLIKIMMAMGKAIKRSDNPYFKSKYADLDAVRGTILDAMEESDNYLLIQQYPITDYSKVVNKKFTTRDRGTVESEVPLLTVITRITEPASGEWQESDLSCYPAEDTPQAIGSAITYLRRYSLMPIFNIAPADDDGNAASGKDMNQDPSGRPPRAPAASQRATKPPTAAEQPPAAAAAATQAPKSEELTPEQRESLGLIDGNQFDNLSSQLKKSGITGKQWRFWLKSVFAFDSLAKITNEKYAEILKMVSETPDQIKTYKEPF